jgi:DNA polymerase-4
MADRTILHLDMDAFYASVEVRDQPSLRGLAVIVGGHPTRGVVLTCTYEARKFGVRSAMPMVQAKRLAPDAIVVPPRMEAYSEASRRVFACMREVTPLVEGLSLDEAFLDVTASASIFGDGATIAARLKRAIVDATGGLRCSVGVARCKYVAKVASDLRKPDALVVVPPGTEAAFLAPLGVERLWGVGPKSAEHLRALGLRTIGDVQAAPFDRLVDVLGLRAASHYRALSLGDDDRPVDPSREAKSIGSESTFEADRVGKEPLIPPLLLHAEEIARRLRASGLVARALVLKIKRADHSLLTRRAVAPAPMCEAGELHRLALSLLERVDEPALRARLVGLSATDLTAAEPAQRELFEALEPPAKPRKLGAVIDAIEARFGQGAVRRALGDVEPETRRIKARPDRRS